MAEIVIRNLRKTFGDFTAVQSSSFRIEDGEFFMLLGPSGCGKTTTLRMIAGLELPSAGEVYIDGEEVGQKPASQRDIAFVFQMFALYPHMNVRRNIAYPLVSQGMPQDIYDKPATMFVADFIGSPPMNFLRFHGSVATGDARVRLHHQALTVPALREPFDGGMVYGVRPEHVRLSDTAGYRGEIIAAEYLGTTQIVTLKTHNGEVKARIPSDQRARMGETVGLDFNGTTVTLFDSQSGRAIRSDLNEGVLSHG